MNDASNKVQRILAWVIIAAAASAVVGFTVYGAIVDPGFRYSLLALIAVMAVILALTWSILVVTDDQ